MDILLTRPWNHTSMLIPNHGLGYLSTSLKRAGHSPRIVDCIRDRISADDLYEITASGRFPVIGFQVYTFDLDILGEYISRLKSPDRILLAGGPHPSADPIGFLQRFSSIDYCFAGESEQSLPMLIDLLEKTSNPSFPDLKRIPGLYFRDKQEIHGSAPAFNPDLDSLGFPDWEQISPLSYPVAPQGTFTRRLPYAPVIITRGCPYPCTFCAGKLVSGRRIRFRTVNHVLSELQFLVKEYGIREFHIQDDNFTYDRGYVLDFCKALIDSRLDLSWALPNGIRLDTLDKPILQAMEAAGCYSVAVGIEAGSQRILDLMKKQVVLQDLIARVNLIRRVTRWHITGFFILGYPTETIAEMKATIRLSRRLPLDKANFGLLMPLPGTEAAQMALASGWIPEQESKRMSEYRSSFTPAGVTQKQMRRLLIQAFVGFYARPTVILRFIRQIHSRDQVKILFNRLMDVLKS